ncbi:sugar ABC transporter ATP-binding protein [Acuticoccus mangrovi]|uniref:Sugar ABC transporter ATP-binding protein n=1 Tax=Acuticoccus mangrovi TaxID=2796142 RepID=A0A934IJG8_9HYPH|nr:sugar ABC transporter ATP-binding protein [Acuticoccus mangrovi]MBJ3777618.1 sugar ABC transporter ATP-binding protein [Acuticoccus mangrovi]
MEQLDFEARGVSKRFGVVTALNDVSIGIAAGEVHAVIGENGAGKSTLMNLFCGRLKPTEGSLYRHQAPVTFETPMDAQRAGIAIAPQEVNLVPRLSVAENVVLGAQSGGSFGIDWKATRARALESLAQIDDTIDPDVPVFTLSKAQQQLVQIARAVATDARILIFDEPTAALTQREADRLFAFIRRFREEGGAVFYISHRLDEILDLSDRISVLRDGTFVGELDPTTTDKDAMVRAMAGRAVAERSATRATTERGDVVLKVDGLTRTGEFRNVSFSLRRGEILGIAGLVGSGRTEVGRCVFGVTRPEAGTIEIFGKARQLHHPADAITAGLVYLPEERKQDGIFPLLSISENMGIATMEKWRGVFGMRFSDMVREVETYIRRIPIKVGDPSDPITSLSGGNQQKVILARWLMKESRILILDEPTRGIDVNAKLEIQDLLRGLADEGLSIVYISSELQEVLDVSDRILVMHEGLVKGIEPAASATQESLLALAMS